MSCSYVADCKGLPARRLLKGNHSIAYSGVRITLMVPMFELTIASFLYQSFLVNNVDGLVQDCGNSIANTVTTVLPLRAPIHSKVIHYL